jgi:hypothetical protein
MVTWRVHGASAVGRAHLSIGLGCQDAHGWRLLADGVIIAIADGAGSRPRSGEGSRAAVSAALEAARQTSDMNELMAIAREAIEKLAYESGEEIGAYATTLSVAYCGDNRLFRAAQVGDGIVVVKRESACERLSSVSPEQKGEFANETTFITSDDWKSAVRLYEEESVELEGVAMSTDGLRYKILADISSSVPYEPFFEDIFAYCSSTSADDAAIGRFLGSLDDQTGDDKTLVVAVRYPDDPEAPELEGQSALVVNGVIHGSPEVLSSWVAEGPGAISASESAAL